MSPLQRLRQACRGEPRGPAGAAAAIARAGQGSSAAAEALRGDLSARAAGAPQSQDPRHGLNRVYLSGVLAADPQRDRGRDGEPVALLLVAFPAPDQGEGAERCETASAEVEVPSQVAGVHSEELRAGRSILITGQLSGGGGVIATEIYLGSPPHETGEPGCGSPR
jgi:hypothetical protein